MRIENIRVFGFESAFRGMRNPKDSWDKSDSTFYQSPAVFGGPFADETVVPEVPFIGEADMDLACRLIRRGGEHRKFLRQIMVWVDLTLPRYVWTELDTYKVATVRNSCSTMNKLGSNDLSQADFQSPVPHPALDNVNSLGLVLREAKKTVGARNARQQLKNDLPEGFLQKSTYSMSYETVLSMLQQRGNHRLPEWRLDAEGSICHFLMNLPLVPQFFKALLWRRDAVDLLVQRLAIMTDEEIMEAPRMWVNNVIDAVKKLR